MSRSAADLFAACAESAVKRRGRFSVVLAGGSTPRRAYERLAQPPWRNRVEWPKVHVFWGDERCVPLTDSRSNAGMALDALMSRVDIPGGQVYPIRCHEVPEEAARDYERMLRLFFADGPPVFDLVYLGLGKDGHTASLFPDGKAVLEAERWVVPVEGPDGMARVTLTLPVINSAETVAFLVSGEEKAEALEAVLSGSAKQDHLPARMVNPRKGRLFFLADQAASSSLAL